MTELSWLPSFSKFCRESKQWVLWGAKHDIDAPLLLCSRCGWYALFLASVGSRTLVGNARQESELCCKALCYHSLPISCNHHWPSLNTLCLVKPCFFCAYVTCISSSRRSWGGVVQADTTQTGNSLMSSSQFLPYFHTAFFSPTSSEVAALPASTPYNAIQKYAAAVLLTWLPWY